MLTLRQLADRLLYRSDRRDQPDPLGLEAPRTISELRGPGLMIASSVGYGIHCIDLNGELHLATADLLDTAVAAVYAPDPDGRAEPDLVILDLADVTFLDAVGVAALRRAYDHVRGRAEVRIDLPGHRDPRSMLEVATDHGWLPPAFRPDREPAPARYVSRRGR